MADTPKTEYKLKTDEGVQGALVISAVFILVLALLGIPAWLCILFGLCGGAAVWLMIAYWRAEKIPEDKTKPAQQEEVIKPVKRVFERLPLFRRRTQLPSPFRPKPPRRIGSKREE